MRKISKNASIYEAKQFVEFAIGGLLPAIAAADKAIELYNNRPCIQTGAHRLEAERLAMNATIKTRTLLWKAWSEMFKDEISAKEYSELMDECLKKLRPEGENVKSEGIFWIGKVGKELNNGKEVK